MQSLNHDHMAVSKLCCPTCRIFLQHLGSHELGNFSVRGHHSTLYLVDLPGLVPDALLQEMITEFRHYLGEELKKVALSPPTLANHGHSRTPSLESAFSQSSTQSDDFSEENVTTVSNTLVDGLVGSLFVPHDRGDLLHVSPCGNLQAK